MKLLILIIILLIILSWISLSYFLLGNIELSWVSLTLPKTMSEFGDATAILNGIFSSFAIVMALIAVLLQGKELKESTLAQSEQAKSLKEQLQHQITITTSIVKQLEEQQIQNKISILNAKQQFHSSELSRMDTIIKSIYGDYKQEDLYKNSMNKKNRHKEQLNSIEKELNNLI